MNTALWHILLGIGGALGCAYPLYRSIRKWWSVLNERRAYIGGRFRYAEMVQSVHPERAVSFTVDLTELHRAANRLATIVTLMIVCIGLFIRGFFIYGE